MLPNISLNSPINSQDTGKQISMLRSQMASLKEAIEDELQSISYDQLDAALRKKIDSLNDSLGMAVEQTAIVAQTLKAKYITANEISAQYATFGTVNAVSARVSNIEADYITTANLTTNYLTANYISALDIKVKSANVTGKLNASQIDAHSIASELLQGESLVVNELDVHLDASFDSISVASTAGISDAYIERLEAPSITSENIKTTKIKGYTLAWKKWADITSSTYILTGTLS